MEELPPAVLWAIIGGLFVVVASLLRLVWWLCTKAFSGLQHSIEKLEGTLDRFIAKVDGLSGRIMKIETQCQERHGRE